MRTLFRNPVALRAWSDRQPSQALAEERYRRLVERSPDGICVHKDGRVLYVNDAGVRLMLADSSDELVGRPITDFVAPESIPPMQAGIAALQEVGDCTPHYPAQMIRVDGTLLPVEVVVVLTIWEDELAYQVITRDVSARHAADAALRYQAALVNHVSDAIIGTTATGVVTSWNPAAEAIYGRSADEALRQPDQRVVSALQWIRSRSSRPAASCTAPTAPRTARHSTCASRPPRWSTDTYSSAAT